MPITFSNPSLTGKLKLYPLFWY